PGAARPGATGRPPRRGRIAAGAYGASDRRIPRACVAWADRPRAPWRARPHDPRVGGARLLVRRPLRREDCEAPVHLRDDRATPCRLDPEEAGCSEPRGGRRVRRAAVTKFEREIGHAANCRRTCAPTE